MRLIDISAVIVTETERAFLLDDGSKKRKWVPKSQIEDNGDGTFTMPETLAVDKEFV